MGLFNSRGRGDKTSEDSKREAKPAVSGDSPGEDRNQSWKTSPVVQSGSDRDQRSRERESAPGHSAGAQGGNFMATIGQSIVFKGELTGDEDLEIDGQVEGDVNLKNQQLTIGANGNLIAQVSAKSIIVIGQVKGNLFASERIEIQATGVVEGDVKAPRLNVQEGAVLNGTIDMSPSSTMSETKKPVAQPAASAAGSAPVSTAQGEALKSA